MLLCDICLLWFVSLFVNLFSPCERTKINANYLVQGKRKYRNQFTILCVKYLSVFYISFSINTGYTVQQYEIPNKYFNITMFVYYSLNICDGDIQPQIHLQVSCNTINFVCVKLLIEFPLFKDISFMLVFIWVLCTQNQ